MTDRQRRRGRPPATWSSRRSRTLGAEDGPDPGDHILEVDDLCVDIATQRGMLHAARGASFKVRRGEALGLVGESGCGKSITLRAILGLLPAKARVVSGRILFDGVEMRDRATPSARKVRRISMIFQEPMTALNPVMRVGEQIAEAPLRTLGYDAGRARNRALELMRMVGIPDPERRLRAYPHELSGGMRQRVMIAIALSCEPQLILCDEPTTALDVTIQNQILDLLRDLQQETHTSVVFVTHDLAVVAQMCQSLAVMYAGQIIETGSVSEVFSAPLHPYTLGLLRSVPDFDRPAHSLASIPGVPPDLVSPPPGCPFQERCEFVQPDCREGDFPLRPEDPGRDTACIHPDACRRAIAREPVIAGD